MEKYIWAVIGMAACLILMLIQDNALLPLVLWLTICAIKFH